MELRLLALDFAKLRATDLRAEAQLAASLGLVGQQHPVLVVAREGGTHVVIDGYRRVRALRRLGRDTAVVLVLGESEAEALAYSHRLATGRRHSRRTTIVSTNLGYDDWYAFLGKKEMVGALLSRLCHHCHTIRIAGPSLRTPDSAATPP